MRILIADDEALARGRLQTLLGGLVPAPELVAEAANGLDALQLSMKFKPDLVLLDIRMPVLDGLECARELARLPESPAIIFTTAYDEYALQAFEVCACDYLLKPVRPGRLAAALDRAERFSAAKWDRLSEHLHTGGKVRDRLCAYVHGEVRLIPVHEVRYFRAEQKYTLVRTTEGETLIEDSLKALEREFSDRFVRVHRNALAAIDYIEALGRQGTGRTMLKLRGIPDQLEVSRRHLRDFRGYVKGLGKADG
jgi:two-component system response regulator AlgR